MKRVIGFIVLLLSIVITPSVGAVSVNDFYFSDFTGDYYLLKDDVFGSRLKVRESVTAVFPDFDQNKGICRQIPFTNQDGVNVTLPSLTRSDISLTRNGVSEPIYSINKSGNFYEVCTGTEEYLHGAQTYVFEYDFVKVVTEFKKDREYQELYWDANGNGAMQRFESVTAKLHFEDVDVWSGDSWCYVGEYGENDQSRCTITKTDDGVMFKAKNLNKYESLTFDAELKPGSFAVPEPDKSYTFVWLTVAVIAICVLWITYSTRKYLKQSEKIKYYNGLFVKPEFQPHTKYSLPEMAEIYIGKKRDEKVAMLLEMVVKHQIEFKKEGKKWTILVKKSDSISSENTYLLEILGNGIEIKDGVEIQLKRTTVSTKLIKIREKMEKEILKNLKDNKLVEAKYTTGYSRRNGGTSILYGIILGFFNVFIYGISAIALLLYTGLIDGNFNGVLVFRNECFVISGVFIVITVIVWAFLHNEWAKVALHTKDGLKESRFMDGLRLYIEMAEAQRLEMLQSVKGADVSAEGIVKLYEKLLPYAALFGLEESWIQEMKDFCEVQEISEPDYFLAGITASELSRTMHNASGYISSASTMASSGGGSSSGFSGGGGGGFSGGGGGGGGFSGR